MNHYHILNAGLMKIGNKHFNVRELESLFSNNFDSPAFPILADYYLNTAQLIKAKKVVDIGLHNDPDNYLGQYVLAKIYIMNDDFEKAKELLLKVVKYQPFNQEATITLIKILISLNKSKNTIYKHLTKARQVFPENSQIKKIYYQHFDKKTTPKKKDVKTQTNLKAREIKFNNKLATKSMYNVLCAQKKFGEALSILNLMSEDKKNDSFVNQEKKKIDKIKNRKK